MEASCNRAAWAGLLLSRLAVGIVLVLLLVPVSLDDSFRMFYALWWYDHPSFYPLPFWLPGQFYLYGLVSGMASDALLTPRIVTLALHLGTGCLLALDRSADPPVRWVAAVWLMLSPLSLVLGTVPLSEALFVLLVLGGLVAMSRFLDSGRPWALAASTLLYLGAALVRYEGWVLLPLFTAFTFAHRTTAISRPTIWALRILPWTFPAVWMLLLWRLEANPVLFLDNIRMDLYGSGDLRAAFSSPASWVIGLQVAAALASLAPGIAAAVRRRASMRDLLWEAHLAAAVLFLAWTLATDNIPSQYAIRLFYPVIVFASVPAARLLAGAVRPSRLVAAGALSGLVLSVAGLSYALTLEPGHDGPSFETARQVREAYARGVIDEQDHVIVDMEPPGTMSLVVYANRHDTVHADAGFSKSYLECWEMSPPGWVKSVRMAVVLDESHASYLETLGWRRWQGTPPWSIYVRPAGSPAPGACP
ncbi:MAG: hypothetical protein JRG91_10265 [Deltaproteobacteria bacterium]|nr:hypothetical protein [Deltaproteobacteria bacterium]